MSAGIAANWTAPVCAAMNSARSRSSGRPARQWSASRKYRGLPGWVEERSKAWRKPRLALASCDPNAVNGLDRLQHDLSERDRARNSYAHGKNVLKDWKPAVD